MLEELEKKIKKDNWNKALSYIKREYNDDKIEFFNYYEDAEEFFLNEINEVNEPNSIDGQKRLFKMIDDFIERSNYYRNRKKFITTKV